MVEQDARFNTRQVRLKVERLAKQWESPSALDIISAIEDIVTILETITKPYDCSHCSTPIDNDSICAKCYAEACENAP